MAGRAHSYRARGREWRAALDRLRRQMGLSARPVYICECSD
jgi:hypothetical protein